MRFIVALLALALPLLACADGGTPAKPAFDEGKNYTVISGRPKPAKTGKIKVTEFFWYGCGHCYQFEPLIEAWRQKMPADVEFEGSPAMWSEPMVTHAKMYFTAKSLNQLDKLHRFFFDTKNLKHLALVKPDEIEKVVTEQGLDGKVFTATMDSFAVDAQVKLADARQKNYGISSTPELVVGDYYLVKAAAGGHKEMLEVVDFLIDKIRSER